MISSMTGFGRFEQISDERKVSVEIKSVNHRYLDLGIKMPRKLSFLEGQVRNLLKSYMKRGKVDVFICYEDYTQSTQSVKYNHDLAASYLKYLTQMSEEFGLDQDIRVSALSRYPEVFSLEEQSIDEDAIWANLEPAIHAAGQSFAQTRQREGENLKKDMLEKLDGLAEKVALVEERSPEVIALYREKLEKKMKEVLEDTTIEESRIAAEVIMYSDKVCNDEETVRLKSHIDSMKKILKTGSPDGVGRKMDFIAQEMNREANTILSKSNDLVVSNLAIDLKTEIEKIREQVQNLE